MSTRGCGNLKDEVLGSTLKSIRSTVMTERGYRILKDVLLMSRTATVGSAVMRASDLTS